MAAPQATCHMVWLETLPEKLKVGYRK